MRIAVRVAVPGEVFGNRQHAAAFQPLAVGHHLAGNQCRVLAKERSFITGFNGWY